MVLCHGVHCSWMDLGETHLWLQPISSFLSGSVYYMEHGKVFDASSLGHSGRAILAAGYLCYGLQDNTSRWSVDSAAYRT